VEQLVSEKGVRMTLRDAWRGSARALKRETYALYLAYRDPRTPWYAKIVALSVVAYALSPIDLIPDPIPVLGHLDDLIIVPLGLALARRLIPEPVLAESRRAADALMKVNAPGKWVAACIVLVLWVMFAIVIGSFVWQALGRAGQVDPISRYHFFFETASPV
jgi:uncharacterized membrane protein YkvA (DUF1232 family)